MIIYKSDYWTHKMFFFPEFQIKLKFMTQNDYCKNEFNMLWLLLSLHVNLFKVQVGDFL